MKERQLPPQLLWADGVTAVMGLKNESRCVETRRPARLPVGFVLAPVTERMTSADG